MQFCGGSLLGDGMSGSECGRAVGGGNLEEEETFTVDLKAEKESSVENWRS